MKYLTPCVYLKTLSKTKEKIMGPDKIKAEPGKEHYAGVPLPPVKKISFEVAQRLYKSSRVDLPKRYRKGKTKEEILVLRWAAFVHNLKKQYGITVLKADAETEGTVEIKVKCEACDWCGKAAAARFRTCQNVDSPKFNSFVNADHTCPHGEKKDE